MKNSLQFLLVATGFFPMLVDLKSRGRYVEKAGSKLDLTGRH